VRPLSHGLLSGLRIWLRWAFFWRSSMASFPFTWLDELATPPSALFGCLCLIHFFLVLLVLFFGVFLVVFWGFFFFPCRLQLRARSFFLICPRLTFFFFHLLRGSGALFFRSSRHVRRRPNPVRTHWFGLVISLARRSFFWRFFLF